MTWDVSFSSAAIRDLGRLPARVLPGVVEFVDGALRETPWRVGKEMRAEFTGIHSARRGAYRVLYEIDPERQSVRVVRVGHRATVYRPMR